MRKIICKELGDAKSICLYEFQAKTYDDLLEQAQKHVLDEPSHQREREQMASASEEDKIVWRRKAQEVWDSKPEM